MTRLTVLPVFVFLLLFHFVLTDQSCNAADRPNILLIYLDDFGWRDTGFNGSQFYETPNMDRIADEGMNFVNAYANAPNCAPSRACLMSGQYSSRHGIYTVGNSDRGKSIHRRLVPVGNQTILPASVQTLPETIRGAGYATCFLGKWHLGEKAGTGPMGQGFDVNFGGLAWGHPKGYFSPYQNPYLKDGPPGEYLTDRLTTEAIGFITKQLEADQPKPFFVCLSHYAVHTPIQAKKAITRKFSSKAVVDGQKNPKYAAMIESVDLGIGRIFEVLQQSNALDDTLIILYSDNGGYGGATDNTPLRGSKGMLYEGGIRVPLAMRWPKSIKSNSVCQTPVIGTDLYPTLAKISGGVLPANQVLDGESILPLMKGGTALKRDAVYWHFPAYLQGRFPGSRNQDKLFRTRPAGAIRSGDWKLIEFFEDGGLELYNLKNDLRESKNLATSHPSQRDELYQKLKSWRQETVAPVPKTRNPDFRKP
ncbi:MAG: sulfatase [Planctomycetota bacterium]|nr:sulfatase [Planctomycetota bacterium]